jgi:hypothetical protein
MRRFLAPALAMGLAGCSAVKQEATAEQAVTRFHKMLDAGQYEAIYDQSAPEMKAATSRAGFLRMMDGIHRKLGAVKASNRQGWNVNYLNGVGTVTLGYQTRFANGSGQEQFVYRTGASPALVGYNVNSPALLN